MAEVTLRPLTTDDAPAVHRVFQAAVAATGPAYSAEQRAAWASGLPSAARWRKRLGCVSGVLASRDGAAVGFMALGGGGYLDLAFVHPASARQGVGARMLAEVERRARARGALCMTTQASLAAQGFFDRNGWRTACCQRIVRQGIALHNFRMWKDL